MIEIDESVDLNYPGNPHARLLEQRMVSGSTLVPPNHCMLRESVAIVYVRVLCVLHLGHMVAIATAVQLATPGHRRAGTLVRFRA
jgi:hypothetical protein